MPPRSSPSITSTTKRAKCLSGSHSSTDGGRRNAVRRSKSRKLLIAIKPPFGANQWRDSSENQRRWVKSDRLLEEAQLQGASLQDAAVQLTDLSHAYLWRSNVEDPLFYKVDDIRLPDAPNTWSPVWRDESLSTWKLDDSDPKELKWNQKAYQDLQQIIELLPPGSRRDEALERVKRLDCATADNTLASCATSASPPAVALAWQRTLNTARVDEKAYTEGLVEAFRTFLCRGDDEACYVLRGLL